MRRYVVAAWRRRHRRRERDLRLVEADTAEHAITKVVNSDAREAPVDAVYEAWPPQEPEQNLRMTFRPTDD